jgi:hypothetical protein
MLAAALTSGRNGPMFPPLPRNARADRLAACVISLLAALLQSRATCCAQPTLEPSAPPAPTEELTVDVGNVLTTTRHRPLGINVDYLMDDDRNPLLAPQRPLREALRELGSKFLRYPGGWKSAINLWSIPPYTSSRPTLAGRVPETWIRLGLRLTPDGELESVRTQLQRRPEPIWVELVRPHVTRVTPSPWPSRGQERLRM